MKDDGIRDLTKDSLICPVCAGSIEFFKDVQNPQPIKKGNIVVCGHCANVLKVGDTNLLRMDGKEVGALDPTSKAVVTKLVLGVLQKNAKASKANPSNQ